MPQVLPFPTLQNAPGAAIPVYAVANAQNSASFYNLATSVGARVYVGAGALFGISVNTAQSASSITLYDGIDATGVKIGQFATTTAGPVTMPSPLAFTNGLYAVVAGATAPDVTVLFLPLVAGAASHSLQQGAAASFAAAGLSHVQETKSP